MCMFCVAVPATLVAGVSVERRQVNEREEALARGEPLPGHRIAARPVTLALTGLLICASVLYHAWFPV